jgi:hypothetical protein
VTFYYTVEDDAGVMHSRTWDTEKSNYAYTRDDMFDATDCSQYGYPARLAEDPTTPVTCMRCLVALKATARYQVDVKPTQRRPLYAPPYHKAEPLDTSSR